MPFLNSDQLETTRRQVRDLLLSIRGLADETEQKVKALDRKTFAPGHIQAETSRIRSEAGARAQELYNKLELPTRLSAVEASREHWTPAAFLARARLPQAPAAHQSQDAVLRLLSERIEKLYWLGATQKMSVTGLAEALDMALDAKHYTVVSEIQAEIESRRSSSNDPNLAILATRLLSLEIDDVVTATTMAEETLKIGDRVNSALRSITSGADDVGKRMEQAEAIGRERQAARDAETAQFARDRAGAVAARDFGH